MKSFQMRLTDDLAGRLDRYVSQVGLGTRAAAMRVAVLRLLDEEQKAREVEVVPAGIDDPQVFQTVRKYVVTADNQKDVPTHYLTYAFSAADALVQARSSRFGLMRLRVEPYIFGVPTLAEISQALDHLLYLDPTDETTPWEYRK